MTLVRSFAPFVPLPRPTAIAAIALAVLSVTAPARPVFAANGAAPEAARHFDQGVKLYEEGDWRGALVEFERAYATLPNYRVLYDIGQCRFQLQDYAGALEALQKYLAEGGGEIPADRREKVTATIDDLNMRVAHVRVTSNVAGAEVEVDDVAVGTTPLAAPILVSVGRRRIGLTAPGHAPIVRFVDVAGQDTVDVPLHVDAAPDVRPPASAPAIAPLAVAPAKAAGHRSLAPAWIGFGVAAAGAFVSTYFGVSAIENKRDLDRQCTSKVCPPESRSLIDESNRNALVSTIGAVAGGVGVAFGVGWLVYAQSGEHAPAPSQTLRVTVGPLWAGAAGSF